MRSNRHSRIRNDYMHNRRITSNDRQMVATNLPTELRAQFDALPIHVRIRLTQEARKIAANNCADYDATLEAHFKFYLSIQP
jgi:hypothetical protein